MLNPFQRLLFCSRQGQKNLGTLLVASGSSIYTFNASDGKCLSRWSNLPDLQPPPPYQSKASEKSAPIQSQEPPEKRRKLSSDNGTPDQHKRTIEVPEVPGNRRPKKSKAGKNTEVQAPIVPFVTNLCSTSDGKHIVAVTGEDKSVRVFTLSERGVLEQLSHRVMPKRPNALTLTIDQATILCGDKFGDVYALPLLDDSLPKTSLEAGAAAQTIEKSPEPKAFVPAANSSTVHSRGNLEALKQQQNAKSVGPKKELQFKHELLLGHVSMLTDIASISVQFEEGSREYILTSDRDEHIRVSRGMPQAHIIENFCLGHFQFISKICSLPWQPETLISGGGDDFIVSWDWVTGDIKQEIDVRTLVQTVRSELGASLEPDGDSEEGGVTVSNIGAVHVQGQEGQVIVLCEGVPALFTYKVDSEGLLSDPQIQTTTHNVLDAAIDRKELRIIYSLDNAHRPLSFQEREAERSGPFVGVQKFSFESRRWVNECDGPLATTLNAWGRTHKIADTENDPVRLSERLYGIGKMRKRGTDEQD